MSPTANRESARIASQAKRKQQEEQSDESPRSVDGLGRIVQVELRDPEGPNEPCGENDSPIRRFLRALYQEIHESSVLGVDEIMQSRIQTLIRRTRSRNFLQTRRKVHQKQYRQLIENRFKARTTNASRQPKLNLAITHFIEDNESTPILDGILERLVCRCGYVILSICLHSRTFLEFVETGRDEYQVDINSTHKSPDDAAKSSMPQWKVRVAAIAENQGSLELFAKVRGLDIFSPIHFYEDEFQLLQSTAFRLFHTEEQRSEYGFKRTRGLHETHQLEQWEVPGRHWALASKEGAPAQSCSITYSVTDDLAEEFPKVEAKETLTELQEDIDDSTVLTAYEWPNRQMWPSDDPREDGYEAECTCCGSLRGPVPRKRSKEDTRPCRCTLRDLQLRAGMPRHPTGEPRDVLHEIITTSRFGRGVRALQNIRKDDWLGIYHGEIYPRSKLTDEQLNRGGDDSERRENRYGKGLGGAYILDQRTALFRHWVQSRKKKKSKKSFDSPTETRLLEKIDKKEWRRYAIDAAVKGNWTRYLNHSCDSNVRFEPCVLGGKRFTAVFAAKDVTFGELLTIDYGPSYFPNQEYACKCGVECCLYWNPENKALETVFLNEAIKSESAPPWTIEVEEVPIPASEEGWKKAKELNKRNKGKAKRRDERHARGVISESKDQGSQDDGGHGDGDGHDDGQDDGDDDAGGDGAKAAASRPARKSTQTPGTAVKNATTQNSRAGKGGRSTPSEPYSAALETMEDEVPRPRTRRRNVGGPRRQAAKAKEKRPTGVQQKGITKPSRSKAKPKGQTAAASKAQPKDKRSAANDSGVQDEVDEPEKASEDEVLGDLGSPLHGRGNSKRKRGGSPLENRCSSREASADRQVRLKILRGSVVEFYAELGGT